MRPSLTHRVLITLLVLLLLAPAFGAPSHAAVDRAARRAPTIGPASAVAGEKVTVRITLPTRFRRPTVLQRKQGTRWVRVARKRSGARGTVAYVVTAAPFTLRVVAPRTRRQGRRVAAYTSRPRTFVPRIPTGRLVAQQMSGAVPASGALQASVSADGRYVAFVSDSPDITWGDGPSYDVFLHDRRTLTTILLSRGTTTPDGSSYQADISDDGSAVVFTSAASNLVGGDTNGTADVFVWRRDIGVSLVSVDALGGPTDGASGDASVSADGRHVAFETVATDTVAGDTNGAYDVVVRDTLTGANTLVSHGPGGVAGDNESRHPAISGNAQVVVYDSYATNLAPDPNGGIQDVFAWTRAGNASTRVSRGPAAGADSASLVPDVSADGRLVVYTSLATNLVAGDTNGYGDVVLTDRSTGRTTLVSVDRRGGPADQASGGPAISADGTAVAYASIATDLVAGDTNTWGDVFVRLVRARLTVRVSVDRTGAQATGGASDIPSVANGGRWTSFVSDATSLVAGDTNATADVFLTELRPVPA